MPSRATARAHRNVPPLFKDGRLFVPGDCVVFAVDAYNGTILWKREVPDSRRLGVFLDGSNMIVDERCLYVAVGDQCRAYDVTTGRPAKVFRMVQPAGGEPRKWGYLACQNSILFGSGCRPDASYSRASGVTWLARTRFSLAPARIPRPATMPTWPCGTGT